MKIGLKYTYKPNPEKLTKLSNVLITSGAGCAFLQEFLGAHPKISALAGAVGFVLRLIAEFSTDQ